MGKQKNMFGGTFSIHANFKNISGLKEGNYVRYAGINVGTIDNISMLNDTTVAVGMIMQNDIRPYIKEDAMASIGSDGLMGDKLIIISPGSYAAPLVKEGGNVRAANPVDVDRIVNNLSKISDNAEALTGSLASVMTKINNGEGSFGRLINDDKLVRNLEGTLTTARETVGSVKKTANSVTDNMEAAKSSFLLRGYFKKKERKRIKDSTERANKLVVPLAKEKKLIQISLIACVPAGNAVNPRYIRENTFVRHHFFLSYILFAGLAILLSACACNKQLGFEATTPVAVISFNDTPLGYPMATMVAEASGIADSKINPGYLWVEEDSGNPPQLYLLSHTGASVKKVFVKGAANTDWEDIALANGPDATKKYLYIGEIGDNDGVHASSGFYRFEEPLASTDTVRTFDFIRFVYADGPRDAEAFLVDDNTKDIYIITKRDAKSGLYKISYPYSTTAMNTAVFIQSLPYNGVVSAAASSDGSGIIIKTYPGLYYYARTAGESVPQTLQKEYKNLVYKLEPQGEAVCFAFDNSGFFTLSEKGNGTAQSLYFYKKM